MRWRRTNSSAKPSLRTAIKGLYQLSMIGTDGTESKMLERFERRTSHDTWSFERSFRRAIFFSSPNSVASIRSDDRTHHEALCARRKKEDDVP